MTNSRKRWLEMGVGILLGAGIIIFVNNSRVFAGRTRIALICVDGATWNIMGPMVQRGELPQIAALIAQGSSGELYSADAFSPPCWTSIATGKTKEQHAVYGFYDSDKRNARYLWEILSDCGKRVGIVNWLMSTPAVLNGPACYLGWTAQRFWACPKEFQDRLAGRISINKLSRQGPVEGYRYIDEREKDVQRAAEMVVQAYRPDFIAVGFLGLNPYQHRYWSAFEPQLFDISEAEVREKEKLIVDYYKKIDRFVEFFKRQGYTIVLVSDHGFCRNDIRSGPRIIPFCQIDSDMQHINLLVNKILSDTGYLIFEAKPEDGGQIDFKKSRAYFFNDYRRGKFGIKINPQRVDSGEAENVIQEIADVLRDVHVDTGDRVFSHIHITAPRSAQVPDITVELSDVFAAAEISYHTDTRKPYHLDAVTININGQEVRKIFVKDRAYNSEDLIDYSRDGVHEHEGILIISGPNIRKNVRVQSASVYDITPTMLYLFGLPVGRDMDGRVLAEVVDPYLLRKFPLRFVATHVAATRNTRHVGSEQTVGGFSREELKSLGYAQ